MATQDQIADKLDQVTWHGHYLKAVCPFHDDREPSLLVFIDGFYCLGCQKRGSLSELWRAVSGRGVGLPSNQVRIRFPQGDQDWFLAEAHTRLLTYPDLGLGLKNRGLEARINIAEIGWWEGWYTLPLKAGSWVKTKRPYALRATPDLEAYTKTRYIYPPDQDHRLHVPRPSETMPTRMDDSRGGPVFVVFGLLDAEAIADLGFEAITSTKGKRITASDLHSVRRPLIVLPDRGEESEARILAGDLGWRGRWFSLPYEQSFRFPDLKDPADFLKHPQDRELLLETLTGLAKG